jgi:hypothetical protein
MNITQLIAQFASEFSGGRFNPDYVNDPVFLKFYRLHSRVCGIIAKIGFQLGYIVDFGRKYPIDPIKKDSGRHQRQAEADISFIETKTDNPIALFDYETSDAPIEKIRSKFDNLRTFKKNTYSLELISLIVTVTSVQHNWKKSNGTYETNEERVRFTKSELIELCKTVSETDHNREIDFLLGIFRPDCLKLLIFNNGKSVNTKKYSYST